MLQDRAELKYLVAQSAVLLRRHVVDGDISSLDQIEKK